VRSDQEDHGLARADNAVLRAKLSNDAGVASVSLLARSKTR
jgi:hypothetical protein